MDAATFTALYCAHYGLTLAVAARFGVAPDEREDVAQEVFVRLWQQATAPQNAGGWLYTVTHNILVDRARETRRVAHGALDVVLALHGRTDDVDDKAEAALLLERLEPRDRSIVEMILAGYTGDEAGAAMGGINKASVYRNYHYALAVMRGHAHGINRGNALKGYGAH